MDRIGERIEALEQRLQQLRARRERLAARARALAQQRSRKLAVRRKILVGEAILRRVERGLLAQATLMEWLGAELTGASERAVFDLPARADPATPVTEDSELAQAQ